MPTIKREGKEAVGGRGEEKVSHRIFLFVCFAILSFIAAVVIAVVVDEQSTRHAWHILSDWMSFRGQITFSNAIKGDTVCKRAYVWACARVCVSLACDVSLFFQSKSQFVSNHWNRFSSFCSAWHLWKSVASFLCCTNFHLAARVFVSTHELRMSTFVIIHHSLSHILTYLSHYFFLFFSFFRCFCVWVSYGVFCDKISPPISYQLI